MKLVLYSGGDHEDNIPLDLASFELTGENHPSITYIPSWSYDGELDFQEFVKHYQNFGIRKFVYFPIDHPFDETLLKAALSSHIIHLSGGNTYYFLKYLRQSNIIPIFKDYLKRGGVITGLSAGSILMTPNINSAGYPEFDKDENEEEITSFEAMNFVNFEFFPHYKNSKRYEKELLLESKKTLNDIYALPDGSGLIYFRNQIHMIGRGWLFRNGQRFNL